MRKFLSGAASFLVSLTFFQTFAIAQIQSNNLLDSPFKRLEIINALQRPPQPPRGKIEQIELGKNGFGWARTASVLWRTENGGMNWREITPPKSEDQRLSGAIFINESINVGNVNGFAILTDEKNMTVELAQTSDGGASWVKNEIDLPKEVLAEADLKNVSPVFDNIQHGRLILRLQSSSNFIRYAVFSADSGGSWWDIKENIMLQGEFDLAESYLAKISDKKFATAKINGKDFYFLHDSEREYVFDAPLDKNESVLSLSFFDAQNGWLLAGSGRCNNFKADCEQAAKLLATNDGGKNWKDITPAAAKQSVKIDDVDSAAAANTQIFAPPPAHALTSAIAPPGGSTRISLNRGFDKCTAAPVAQMQIWWNESPFYDSNIYISGRNRGCAQPQLSAAWVSQVSAQGWGLIPTIVGYQSPCSVCVSCQKHSSDPGVAETQGRGEADIAINDANNLGFAPGTILYYDMERYDDLSGTGACSTPTKAFLKGWTDRLHEQGYISGTYGSPTNAINDWVNIPAASRMDAVWLARWNNNASVWGAAVAPLTDAYWRDHQRIHQYQAPANATWGGITFNIDGNISDGPVAGVRPARNKPSDFDGDGKSDVAVFRPETGYWYVLQSATNSFSAVQFGVTGDVITPGDYDGDGRTDVAVFRPDTGVWYASSSNPARPNASVFRTRQFGMVGDIPVAADYDGDGNTDIAVFRRGNWFITTSFDPLNPNFRSEAFGLPDDLPVPGDYDADGKADVAVYRPSNGVWYVMQSSLGFTFTQFGANADNPMPGDYDNDGKTDFAVFRPDTGMWYLLQSSTGFAATQFGIATDQPAPGDFDGDGRHDPAVFRRETGTWFISQSQMGFAATQFGTNGDKPVPSGYIP